MKKGELISATVFAVILLDQVSKYFLRLLKPDFSVIGDFLSISYSENTGASFGILKPFPLLLMWVTVIIIGFILFYYDRIPKKKKFPQTAFALILGGAFGNLIDRIFFGFVTDFIDFSFWPAFNIADSAVFIGAILAIIYFWKE